MRPSRRPDGGTTESARYRCLEQRFPEPDHETAGLRRGALWTPVVLPCSRAAADAEPLSGAELGFLNQHDGAGRPTIYLDIDGVVTTVAYQRKAGKDRLNPAQIARVAALVREFDARIVVSSTWRVADCRPTLVMAGLPEDCFHSDWHTAILPTSRDPETGAMLAAEKAQRGGEIAEHAARNSITKYLVLDDVDVGPAHASRHVRPKADDGLSEADGILARRILAKAATA